MAAFSGRLKMSPERYNFPTLDLCCRDLAEHIIDTARQCVADSGVFTLVASGGSTPKPLYRLLASPPFVEQMPWQQTHLFWGDERCVDADHPDSNYRMVKAELLPRTLPTAPTIHRMPGEMLPTEGAKAYEKDLRNFFSNGNNHIKEPLQPVFDLILLGLGDDGHTASLFPNSPALTEKTKWVTATPPGVLPPQVNRLTLTLPVINNAAEVIFLAAGEKKKALIDRILNHRLSSLKYPAALVAPQGKLLWYNVDA